MRILALIAARGGSKRVPGKNLRLLGARPLLAWSVDVAKDVPDICDILVSTDDAAIASAAQNAGALVPWLRPAELATDTASSADVCLHALDWYERENGKVDGLLLLQPTSPFRSRATVLRGIELFRTGEHRPVVGVSTTPAHPFWCFRIEAGTLRPFIDTANLELRSQDLPPAYVVNGVLYVITPDDLRKRHSFMGGDAQALVIADPREGIDIDSEWDWIIAQAVLALGGADDR